jgi:hypothetical protein
MHSGQALADVRGAGKHVVAHVGQGLAGVHYQHRCQDAFGLHEQIL